jgi:protein-S-isoprenylcysteine O-methyltransferase Ste14
MSLIRYYNKLAGIFFLLQAGLVVLWWGLLVLFPSFRTFFIPSTSSEYVLFSFFLGDLLLITIGSLLAGYSLLKHKFATHSILLFLCGAISYATLYTLSLSLITGTSWIGAILMIFSMTFTILFTWQIKSGWKLSFGAFKTAKDSSLKWLFFKTSIQIVIMWGLSIFLVPSIINYLELTFRIPQFYFFGQSLITPVIFFLASIAGLNIAFLMVKKGKGTPLPMDGTQNLVVAGAYKYVRNPMALFGGIQVISVGLWLGSFFVIAYAMIGILIWQLFARPAEEKDLEKRFGESYIRYKKEVRCWIPRFRGYKNAEAGTDITI